MLRIKPRNVACYDTWPPGHKSVVNISTHSSNLNKHTSQLSSHPSIFDRKCIQMEMQ